MISILAESLRLCHSYWPSAAPQANTTDLGAITRPIWKSLINNPILLITYRYIGLIRDFLPSQYGIHNSANIDKTRPILKKHGQYEIAWQNGNSSERIEPYAQLFCTYLISWISYWPSLRQEQGCRYLKMVIPSITFLSYALTMILIL